MGILEFLECFDPLTEICVEDATVAQRTPTLLPHSCGTRYFAILSSTLFL